MLNRDARETVEIEGVGIYDIRLDFRGVRPDPDVGVIRSMFDGYVNDTFIGEYSAAQGNTDPDTRRFLLYACEDADNVHLFSFREWALNNGMEDDPRGEEVYNLCLRLRDRLLAVMSSEEIASAAEVSRHC